MYDITSKGTKAEIKIYGPIMSFWKNTSDQLSQKLRELNEDHNEITIRLNSRGGSVPEGVAIYNVIKDVEAKVIIIVEGMAASIASFLCLAADEVKMGRATRQMLHEVSGGAAGNAQKLRDTAKMMEDWQEDLVKEYSEKLGISAEETKNKYFQPNKDTWLSADECVKLGLADEVINGPVKDEPKNLTDPADIFSFYDVRITNASKSNQNRDTMEFTKTELKNMGLPEDASKEQIMAKMDELKDSAKEAEDLRIQKEQEDKERLKSILDQAIKDGKIESKARETYEGIAEKSGVKAVENVLESIKPGHVDITDHITSSGGGGEKNRKDWTLDDWQERDPQGLAKMEKEDPESFNKLQDDWIENQNK